MEPHRSSLSTTYNDELCFIIVGIRDVGGLEWAYKISKHLQTLSLKTCDILANSERVWYEYVYIFI
jgi:hypothetical protein